MLPFKEHCVNKSHELKLNSDGTENDFARRSRVAMDHDRPCTMKDHYKTSLHAILLMVFCLILKKGLANHLAELLMQ